MNILIVSYYFPPMNSVASLRIYSWARTWTDLGHAVTVLTAPKPHNDNLLQVKIDDIEVIEATNSFLNIFQHVLSKKYSKRYSEKKADGIVHPLKQLLKRMNHWRLKRGILYTLRMPDHLSLWKQPALKTVKGRTFDLVVSSFGPYVTHLIANQLVVNGQAKKWIADYRDLWVDHGLMKGLFPFSIVEKRMQDQINRQADVITTVSGPLAKILSSNNPSNNKVHVIYNGYFEKTHYIQNQPGILNWDLNKKHLIYTGSIYEGAQDYSPLLRAIKNLKVNRNDLYSRLEIHISGRSTGKLRGVVQSQEIQDCFIFEGNVAYQTALQMQKEADALLFFDYDPEIMAGVITGKLFEYMTSGTEIWSIGKSLTETDSNGFILKSNTGIVLGKNVQAIYRQLIELLSTKPKPPVKRNRDFIKQFSREEQAKKMLGLAAS